MHRPGLVHVPAKRIRLMPLLLPVKGFRGVSMHTGIHIHMHMHKEMDVERGHL